MKARTPHPPGRHPRRVLAVRVLLARLAWLEAPLRWDMGRIVWQGPQGAFTPQASDLSRSQSLLHKIAQYPVSADLALGDRIAWLAERQARLHQAKQLREIYAPDLAHLARQARATQGRNPRVIAQFTQLLSAEALCLNPLPVSPAATLFACRSHAVPALYAVVEEEEQSLPVRVLAALTLGALARDGESLRTILSPHPSIRNAFRWGLQEGMPSETHCLGLVVSLLCAKGGDELARRALTTLMPTSSFSFTVEEIRGMLNSGLPAVRSIELSEALRMCEGVLETFRRRKTDLPPAPTSHAHRTALRLLAKRNETVDALAVLIKEYLFTTREPKIVPAYLALVQKLFSLVDWSPRLLDSMKMALQHGLGMPAELMRAYIRLLDAAVIRRLELDRPKFIKRPDIYVHELTNWFQGEYHTIGRMLNACRDEEITREALEFSVHIALQDYRWKDLGYYRLVLACIRQSGLGHDYMAARNLCTIVDCYPTLNKAQSAVKALMDVFKGIPQPIYKEVLDHLLEGLSWSRQNVRQLFPLLPEVTPDLIRYAQNARDMGDTYYCVEAAYHLLQETPACAVSWNAWIVDIMLEAERDSKIPFDKSSIDKATVIGAALANGDTVVFQTVFRSLARHEFTQSLSLVKKGLRLLKQHPGLRTVLAHLWPQQPDRCAELLVRFALIPNLGPDALAPLALLEPGDGDELLSEEWSSLQVSLPELAETARAYRYAQHGLGRSTAMPSGVRRGLHQAKRMTTEAHHLERQLINEDLEATKREELEGRLRVLRERIADEARTESEVRENVTKRLMQVTVEARFAHAEQQVFNCFRARLDRIAGPLPPDLRLDDNMLNAVLLSVDIEKNKKLLTRLLREHIAGQVDWRERHPANTAFLLSLKERGIDAKEWLADHPRRYASKHASGGSIHLRLEHDPLHILQMGNYFDTCLSFGGINSFSTIANACELNKRVLFARDGAGRVIGRKLIGLSEEGKLLGFRTYTSLSDEQANTELRDIILHYIIGFTERCGVSLADSGEIPRLFAEDWYDDGEIAWSDFSKSTVASHQSSGRNRIRTNGVLKEIPCEMEDLTTDDGSKERRNTIDRTASVYSTGRV